MTMRPTVCDYCLDPHNLHRIEISRHPNGDRTWIEICDVCLDDVALYLESRSQELPAIPIHIPGTADDPVAPEYKDARWGRDK